MNLDDFMADSNARARCGRAAGRLMITGVVLLLGIAGSLFIAAPNGIGATVNYAGPLAVVVPGAGVVGFVIGLGWMVRILRADPEPDAKAWRYRG